MTLLASDSYSDAGVNLVDHVFAGINVLSYDYTTATDYVITSFSSGGLSNVPDRPNYCRVNIGTVSMGSVSVWADVYRTPVDGFSQGCSFGIACDSANAVFDQSGIYLEIRRSDAAQMTPVIALVDATGTITREVSDLTRISMATSPSGEGRRLVLERQGAVVNMYESDYLTGANPVLLLTLTLTGPESAFYDDGNHLDCGLQVTGNPTSAVVLINAFELNTLADPSCATLFRDDFIDPDSTQLDVHTPAPLASPGTIWEYIEAGAAPYTINSNAVNDDGTGLANPARASQVILDDLIESGGVFNAGGPLTSAQTGQLHICMVETPISSVLGRITAEVNGAGLALFMVADNGSFRTGATAPLGGRDLYLPFEIGVTKAGTRVEMWTQDVGGGNRVSNLDTLTPTEQALYEDGAHRMAGFSCTGTQAGHFVCEYLQVDNFCPVQPSGSSLSTIDSGDTTFNVLQAVTPTGDTLGTLASDVPAIAIALTPIGSSLGVLGSEIPTFTGTSQEASPSAPPAADVLTLPAPPQLYNQNDESQTRRQLELAATLANLRIDRVISVVQAQVVTEGQLTQTNATDIFIADIVPVALDMDTDLTTSVPSRWSEPAEGTLRYTSVDFARLGLVFLFFQVTPAQNNRTFIVDLLINEVIVRTIEFQTGVSGLQYPVSVSDLIPLNVGTTDMRAQISSISATTVDISDFSITSADFFSAIGFDTSAPSTNSVTPAVPVPDTSFLRELVRNFATLLPASSPISVSQNRHVIAGDVSLGHLATGYAQQRGGPNTIVIPAVNTFVALNPTTTLNISSSAWLQPADAELTIITDTKRIATFNLVMVLDTAAANQMFEFRVLLNGTPVGSPYEILLQGNQPQEHALGFLVEIPVGLSTIIFEMQNTSTGQDLDVSDYALAVTDQLADG